MKRFIYILPLVITSCTAEKLSDQSVVEANNIEQQHTLLDTYIEKEFVAPYGISVKYRWNKNTAPQGIHNTPPDTEKVQQVLETIKQLWLEVYTLPNVGGKNFMKGKNPIEIYLYGGKNIDANGKELIVTQTQTAVAFHIYNVNSFNPKNYADVFQLMRSVHHQFARRLMDLYPYNRDTFIQISQKRYNSNTSELPERNADIQYMRSIRECQRTGLNEYAYIVANDVDYIDISRSYFSTGRTFSFPKVDKDDCTIIRSSEQVQTQGVSAHREGFLTLHSVLSADADFAEIVSAYLTHTKKEIDDAITFAKTPLNAGGDAQLQEEYNQEAQQAHSELTQKILLVSEYFKKDIGIDLNRMQTISIQRLKAYVNQ